MTKTQENDIVKIVNSQMRWSIGISVTIAIFVISVRLVEVRKDGEFKGTVNTQIQQINKSIDNIEKKIDAKSEQSSIINIEKKIEEIANDIDHTEFFLASRFGYKPIERNVKL